MVYLVFHYHSQIVSYFHLKNHLHSKDVWTDLTARRGGCQQDGSSSPSSVLPTSRHLESLQQGSKGKSKITSKKLQNLPPSFHPAVIQNLCNEVQLHLFVAAKKIINHKSKITKTLQNRPPSSPFRTFAMSPSPPRVTCYICISFVALPNLIHPKKPKKIFKQSVQRMKSIFQLNCYGRIGLPDTSWGDDLIRRRCILNFLFWATATSKQVQSSANYIQFCSTYFEHCTLVCGASQLLSNIGDNVFVREVEIMYSVCVCVTQIHRIMCGQRLQEEWWWKQLVRRLSCCISIPV